MLAIGDTAPSLRRAWCLTTLHSCHLQIGFSGRSSTRCWSHLRAPSDKGDTRRSGQTTIRTFRTNIDWDNAESVQGQKAKYSHAYIVRFPALTVTMSAAYSGCSYAMGWYVCERPPYRLFQHDGVIAGFMSSNAIVRDNEDGSWMSATVLANIDASLDIVELVRNILREGAQ